MRRASHSRYKQRRLRYIYLKVDDIQYFYNNNDSSESISWFRVVTNAMWLNVFVHYTYFRYDKKVINYVTYQERDFEMGVEIKPGSKGLYLFL